MSFTGAENSVTFEVEMWDTQGRQHNRMCMIKFNGPVLDGGLDAAQKH